MKWAHVINLILAVLILAGCQVETVDLSGSQNDTAPESNGTSEPATTTPEKTEDDQLDALNPDTDTEESDTGITEPLPTDKEEPVKEDPIKEEPVEIDESPVVEIKPVFVESSVVDNQSAERGFTTPPLADFALRHGDIKPAKVMNVGPAFEGNGHSVSWDGRFYIVTQTGGWFIKAFRPENISVDDGLPNFKTGAFSKNHCFEHDGDSPFCETERNPNFGHNWNALVRDTRYEENPYRSDALGNIDNNGEFMTYKAFLFHTQKDDVEYIGRRTLQVVISEPHTPNADIHSTTITDDFTRLTTTTGDFLICIEPSLTVDGQLLFCNGDRTGGHEINDIAYSYNSTVGKTTGWRSLISLANLYSERDVLIDGIALQKRFPIAQHPIRNSEGDTLSGTDEINGAYPWISRDGSELFFQGAKAADDANRTATTVVGRWTGWSLRVIDGPINPDRMALRPGKDENAPPSAAGPRLFISSPGAFTTMWRPFPEIQNLPIPYSAKGAVYPIFGSNTHDYSEVPFNDFVDGNYWLTLNMNELWLESAFNKDRTSRGTQYIINRTPDTSGNFNNGTLVGAKFPVEYNGIDTNRGKVGQAIYFPGNSYVEVARKDSVRALSNGFTVEFFIQPLPAFENSNAMTLLEAENGFTLSADAEGNLSFKLHAAKQEITVNGPALNNGEQWQHIAITYNKQTQALNFYNDSQLVQSVEFNDNLNWQMPATNLKIGALNSGESEDAFFLIDEIKISNLPRSREYLAQAAFVKQAGTSISTELEAQVPNHLKDLLPIAKGLDGLWTNAMAELGETLFSETLLSQNKTTSCASCHQSSLAFTDGIALAKSDESIIVGSLNTPSALNRLFSTEQGWSGGQPDLIGQSLAPIKNPIEMNLSIEAAINRLNNSSYYVDRFNTVFGDAPSAKNLALALSAFQMTLFTPESTEEIAPLNKAQKRGKNLFLNKARCVGCHSGSNFTDESFRNNGIAVTDATEGRMAITGRLRDKGLIKVPTLRQVSKTAPFMHDGSVSTLKEVVEAYVDASKKTSTTIDSEMLPIDLEASDISDLVSYLETL